MTNRTRVLLIRNAFAFDFGGGERFPVLLAEEIQKHNYDPVIISRSRKLLGFARSRKVRASKGFWLKHQDFSGVRVVLFPLYLLWQVLLLIFYLVTIIRLRSDVIHPQSRDDFIAATLAGKLLKKRVIWTDHADLKYVFQNLRVFYKNPIGKLVYAVSKLADNITLVSNSEKTLIEKSLQRPLPPKFVVIHNGVTDKKVLPVKRSADDTDKVIFVATSRLVKAKGIGELIAAFKLINTSLPVKLWLVGEGPDSEEFRNNASDGRISFFGFKDDAMGYVASADIFVHPSYHEGFSISLVEAAMLGKPLVACDVGGNPEIVNNSNGILVPPKDIVSLKQAMERLATSKQLRKNYGQAARKLYEKDFQFEKIVKEGFLPLYE